MCLALDFDVKWWNYGTQISLGKGPFSQIFAYFNLFATYAFWIACSQVCWSVNFTSLAWVKGPSPVLHQGRWSGEKSRDIKLLFLIPSHTWCTCIFYSAHTPGPQGGSGWPEILGERKAAEVWYCPELPGEKVKSEMGMGAGWGSLGEPPGDSWWRSGLSRDSLHIFG